MRTTVTLEIIAMALKAYLLTRKMMISSLGAGRKQVGQVMSLLKKVPFPEKYFTANLWYIIGTCDKTNKITFQKTNLELKGN